MIVAGVAADEQRRALEALADAYATASSVVLAAEAVADPGPAQPGVTLFTSGTTGTPKPVHRPWEELVAEVSPHGSPDDRYLLTYNVARYAGLQVALHAITHESELLIPASLAELPALLDAGASATHLSATPSLLRRLVMGGAAEAMPGVRQVTLGGEYATQADLDLAAKAWPAARVTSIYASTEAGASLAASDGLEGFPASVLERPGKGGRQIRLTSDGEMVVTLPSGREVATGDLWDVSSGRLLFRGRNEEIINVGGLKVSPVKVERVLLGVPGVEAVRVVGRASPITGSVVVAEVVGDASQADLRAAATASLARAEQPMKYVFVDAIEASAANKVLRT